MYQLATDHLLPCRCPYVCWQRSRYLSQALQRLFQHRLAPGGGRLVLVPSVADMADYGTKACRHLTVPLSAWMFPSKTPGITHTAYLQSQRCVLTGQL